MHSVRSVEEACSLSLKDEEKQNRQFSQRNRGARGGTLLQQNSASKAHLILLKRQHSLYFCQTITEH